TIAHNGTTTRAQLGALQAVGLPNPISAAQAGGQQTNNKHNNIMNKTIIVALLKKHGIEASETETDEQLQAKLDQIPAQSTDPAPKATAPAATDPELMARLEKIQARLDKE